MDQTHSYNGSLTAEQFLFYEIRIAAKFYIEGITIEEAVEKIKRSSRDYAKRQLTWFNRNKNIKWLFLKGNETFEDIVNNAVKLLNSL